MTKGIEQGLPDPEEVVATETGSKKPYDVTVLPPGVAEGADDLQVHTLNDQGGRTIFTLNPDRPFQTTLVRQTGGSSSVDP